MAKKKTTKKKITKKTAKSKIVTKTGLGYGSASSSAFPNNAGSPASAVVPTPTTQGTGGQVMYWPPPDKWYLQGWDAAHKAGAEYSNYAAQVLEEKDVTQKAELAGKMNASIQSLIQGVELATEAAELTKQRQHSGDQAATIELGVIRHTLQSLLKTIWIHNVAANKGSVGGLEIRFLEPHLVARINRSTDLQSGNDGLEVREDAEANKLWSVPPAAAQAEQAAAGAPPQPIAGETENPSEMQDQTPQPPEQENQEQPPLPEEVLHEENQEVVPPEEEQVEEEADQKREEETPVTGEGEEPPQTDADSKLAELAASIDETPPEGEEPSPEEPVSEEGLVEEEPIEEEPVEEGIEEEPMEEEDEGSMTPEEFQAWEDDLNKREAELQAWEDELNERETGSRDVEQGEEEGIDDETEEIASEETPEETEEEEVVPEEESEGEEYEEEGEESPEEEEPEEEEEGEYCLACDRYVTEDEMAECDNPKCPFKEEEEEESEGLKHFVLVNLEDHSECTCNNLVFKEYDGVEVEFCRDHKCAVSYTFDPNIWDGDDAKKWVRKQINTQKIKTKSSEEIVEDVLRDIPDAVLKAYMEDPTLPESSREEIIEKALDEDDGIDIDPDEISKIIQDVFDKHKGNLSNLDKRLESLTK